MMEATTATQTPLAAALSYAARGWPVFPVHSIRRQGTLCTCGSRTCGSPGKHPRTQNGLKDASTDERTIRGWWRQWPDAGVAIATGRGLVVVDVDSPKGGDESLVDARRALGELPDTVECLTGGGGRHIYLLAPDGVAVRSSAGQLGAGLDIRGDGGYVVAPPSLHQSGRRYAWEASSDPDDVTVAPLPEGWLARLTSKPRGGAGSPATAAETFGEGQRNDGLFRLARSMRAKGLDLEELEPALQAANVRRCVPPLDTQEVRALARSACSVAPGLSPEVQRERDQRQAEREHAGRRFRDHGTEAVAPQEDADAARAEADAERAAIQGEVVREPFVRGDSVELAEALLAELGAGHPVVHDRGAFWRYDAARGVFVELERAVVYRHVAGYAGALVGTRKPRALSLSDTAIKGVLSAAASYAARPGFFAEAPRGVCFADCWVTARDGEVVTEPHSPTHRATHVLGVPYSPGAAIPQWGRMLREVFRRERQDDTGIVARDEEETGAAVALLQEFAGASLVGLAPRHAVALVLVGPGNDGKSRVLNVLRALFPATAVCSIPPNAWGRGFLLAELAGKRLNVVSELPGTDVQDGDRFKQVVAGDAVTAERKYEAPFTLVPEAGHVFACNELPGTRDQSRGFWRRFAVIPCTRSFTADEEVKDIDRIVIGAELAGIAAWALEGAARLQREGQYTTPKASEEAKADWQEDSDQVRQWVKARCTVLPKGTLAWRETGLDKLYADYRSWAQANGHTPLASAKLGARLATLGHFHRSKDARAYRLELGRSPAKGDQDHG